MAYDRNLLAAKDIDAFKRWLDDNQLAWRAGKGQHQALQVKLKDSWPAVCVSDRGVVTTAPAMREMVQRFNKGQPYTGKTPRIDQDKAVQLAPDQLLEDLRDDFAIAALGMLAHRYGGSMTAGEVAKASYELADAMLTAREARP